MQYKAVLSRSIAPKKKFVRLHYEGNFSNLESFLGVPPLQGVWLHEASLLLSEDEDCLSLEKVKESIISELNEI